jgi:hypothetical protein
MSDPAIRILPVLSDSLLITVARWILRRLETEAQLKDKAAGASPRGLSEC